MKKQVSASECNELLVSDKTFKGQNTLSIADRTVPLRGGRARSAEGVCESHVVASYTPSVSFSILHFTRPPARGTVQSAMLNVF